MALLFSKVDSNKLWHDVQHEENVICAQFDKDLFNISKVIGRKKWHSFFDSQCILIGFNSHETYKFKHIYGVISEQYT